MGLSEGIICQSFLPTVNSDSYQESMSKIDGYHCERPEVGAAWQTDWYSPVCRGWYQEQEA